MVSTKFGQKKSRIEIAFSILDLQCSPSNPEVCFFKECAARLLLPKTTFNERYSEICDYLGKLNYTCLDNSTINDSFKNDYYFEKILITEDKSAETKLDENYINLLADQEIENLRQLVDSLIGVNI